MGPALGGSTAVFALLGGAWYPLAGDSGWLHDLVQLIPSYWLVQAAHSAFTGQWWPAKALACHAGVDGRARPAGPPGLPARHDAGLRRSRRKAIERMERMAEARGDAWRARRDRVRRRVAGVPRPAADGPVRAPAPGLGAGARHGLAGRLRRHLPVRHRGAVPLRAAAAAVAAPDHLVVLAVALLPLCGESGLNAIVFVAVAAQAALRSGRRSRRARHSSPGRWS